MSETLSQSELDTIFHSEIVQDYLYAQVEPIIGVKPRFISVGGQPGAGKGGVLNAAQQELPGAVVVNGDDLREYHPEYNRLMETDPLRMPEVTAQAAGTWVGMSNEWLRERGVSAVVETTLRNEAMLRQEFEAFRAAGFQTELRVVAVPLAVSRLGTVSRYLGQVREFGAGRWTPGAAHDVAAENVGVTAKNLVASGLVDRVSVQGREGNVFYQDVEASLGGVERGEAVFLAIEAARDVRNMSEEQARVWLETFDKANSERFRIGETDEDFLRVCAQLEQHDKSDVEKTLAAHSERDPEAVVRIWRVAPDHTRQFNRGDKVFLSEQAAREAGVPEKYHVLTANIKAANLLYTGSRGEYIFGGDSIAYAQTAEQFKASFGSQPGKNTAGQAISSVPASEAAVTAPSHTAARQQDKGIEP